MIYMRKAGPKDLLSIMKIIEEARTFLADSGSDQWQNAYPAVFDIEEDFAKEQAYVLLVDDKIAGYCALLQVKNQLILKLLTVLGQIKILIM